ncbi:acyl carrier protein [Streptomyces sp. DHE7-1]|nr:acyl carrier protein [Streptomyces sp. DHE7-1]
MIAAVSDGLVPASRPPAVQAAPRAAGAEAPAAPVAAAPAAPAGDRTAVDDELRRVTEVFARVLELAPDQLDPDLTFENYGVDSLVVLELTRALEAVYGPQPATLLFERITVRRLAEHFHGLAATTTGPAPAGDPDPERSAGPAAEAAARPAEPAAAGSRPVPAPAGPATTPGSGTVPGPAAAPAVPGGADEAGRLIEGLSDAAVDELLAVLLAERGKFEGDGR